MSHKLNTEFKNSKTSPLDDIDEDIYFELLQKLTDIGRKRRKRLLTVKKNIKQLSKSIQDEQFAI